MNSLSEGYGLSKTAVIEERILLNPEQIQKRIRELARQISEDYRGKTCCAVAVLDGHETSASYRRCCGSRESRLSWFSKTNAAIRIRMPPV